MPIYEDDITPPIANNQTPLPEKTIMRYYYKERIYPESGVNPIDLWYGRPFYGRVNTDGRAIHISETNMAPLLQTDYFVADFIADAYHDFISEIRTVRTVNSLPPDSFFLGLTPAQGWLNVKNAYHAYFSIVHESFVGNFLNLNNRRDKVKDFDSYLDLFMKFVDASALNLPFTKTSYLLSKYCSPLTSGLMIDLASDAHDEDRIKFQKYLNTYEFECYRNTAARFGFYVDKNAPWRLVGNISSPEMMKYIKQNTCEPIIQDYAFSAEQLIAGTAGPRTLHCAVQNAEQLFSSYYYLTSRFDYESFKIYLFQSYNSYTGAFPLYETWKYCRDGRRTSVVTAERESFFDTENASGFESFKKRYDDRFWLPIYFHVRSKEARQKLNSRDERRILKHIHRLFRTKGLIATIDYIDEITKVAEIYNDDPSRRSPSLKIPEHFNVDY